MANITSVLKKCGVMKPGDVYSITEVDKKRDAIGPYVIITSNGQQFKTYSKPIYQQINEIIESGFDFSSEPLDVMVVSRVSESGRDYLCLVDAPDTTHGKSK